MDIMMETVNIGDESFFDMMPKKKKTQHQKSGIQMNGK